jgi:ectoine hydroxylase-related dioxygenase (phytanoyl-CoA dioxygenase family)
LTFWPIEGTQICSIWVPVDPVTRESSGLEYVRGSHRWNRRFKAVSPDYHPAPLASNLEDPPDIDAHRADYDLVNWDMEPGDVLLFYPLTLHGSRGNSSPRRRRAFATRWLGGDVIYAPVKTRMPLPKGHGLVRGDKLSGRFFPQVLG